MNIKIKDQNGFVLPMVLMITVVFLILAIGLLPNVTAQLRLASFDQDRLRAQYAAEAGAKVAIRQIDTTIENLKTTNANTPANVGAITGGETLNVTSGSGNQPSYSVAYSADNNNNPTQFNITSTGRYNGKQYTTRVIYALQNSPLALPAGGVVNLFNANANYSRDLTGSGAEQPWTLDTTSDGVRCVNPPNFGRYQVLFKGSELDDNFTLSYNASCQSWFDKNKSEEQANYEKYKDDTGYGIFYGATGNADNMTSYVFQWDPGATRKNDDLGSFFVKKIKMTPDTPPNPNNNEWHPNKVTSRTYWPDGTVKSETRGGFGVIDYRIKTDTCDGTGDKWTPTCAPFQDSKSDECGQDGTTRVSIKKLKEYMEAQTKKDFDVEGSHNIQIKVSKLSDGRYRQEIYCDGVLILNFIDESTDLPITFRGSFAGLRVWNSRVCFYNDPNKTINVMQRSTIIWRK